MYYMGYFGPSADAIVGGVQGYPIVTRPDASYDWQEHFTMIKGNHTIKGGGQNHDAYTKSRRDRAHSALYFYYGGSSNGAQVTDLNQLLLGMANGAGRSFGV